MAKVFYALEEVQGRAGELMFLECVQAHWSPSLRQVLKEREGWKPFFGNEDLPMPKVFKLTVEELTVE
jgi:hypothetical protein